MVLAQACGLNRVAALLAGLLGRKEASLRQQLREWYYERTAKRGAQRVDWSVGDCFGPLLAWVLRLWRGDEGRLVLALDATSLKKVFVVLSISVLYRGCAIPVAWQVLPEGKPGSWQKPWLELFAQLHGAVPVEWQVLVLADRGLYARWLWEAIRTNGWHPFLRLNLRGFYRPRGQSTFRRMGHLLPTPGSCWSGRVTCFAHNSVEGTLLASWGGGHPEPWLILTDLDPQAAHVTWYGMRAWIEAGFKDLKHDGWDWHKTRMRDPGRAERFWLALAVATLWTVSVGGQADALLPASQLEDLPILHIARRSKKHPAPPRQLSCFQRGLMTILIALLNRHPFPVGYLIPEPWPLKTYP